LLDIAERLFDGGPFFGCFRLVVTGGVSERRREAGIGGSQQGRQDPLGADQLVLRQIVDQSMNAFSCGHASFSVP